MYPSLEVPDVITDEVYQILLANPDEAFRMLGTLVAPDGNTAKQVKILLNKSQEWTDKLGRIYLTAHGALIGFTQVLFPALIYPVAVLALSESHYDTIMSPAINALLKKLCLPKSTSRLLLYGPARYSGLNLHNLYVQGYIIKLMMIVGHWQKDYTSATILDIVLGTSQQQVGIHIPILESNFTKYGFILDDGWMKKV